VQTCDKCGPEPSGKSKPLAEVFRRRWAHAAQLAPKPSMTPAVANSKARMVELNRRGAGRHSKCGEKQHLIISLTYCTNKFLCILLDG